MSPVRYAPSVEVPEADEAETFQSLIETMKTITATTYKSEDHAIRSVHAKSHALLEGELTIPPGLPPEYAQGLFAMPGTYKVTLRISTSPGDLMDDHVSTPRGLAIKIHGVTGAQLSGNPADSTQDFLMVDGPAFLAPTPKAFLGSVKLLAATTDKAVGLKRAFSATLRGVEKVIETVGGESGKLKSMGGHPVTNPLGETYFTQVPLRYGDYIAKLSAAPLGAIAALKDEPVDLSHRRDGLRAAIGQHFATTGAEWELRAQLNTGLDAMPIEDASVEWQQDDSPYVAVGRISVVAQPSWSFDNFHAIDEGMSFTPWHGLADHQPLGGVNRSRKPVYDALSAERSERLGCPFSEAAHAAR